MLAAAALAIAACCSFAAVPKAAKEAVVIVVSPAGSDSAPGTRERPFHSLERAQHAVREVNSEHDVTVMLEDGIYRLTRPLLFTALDGGRNGHRVFWMAADNAKPVVSGAMQVSGWKIFDKQRQIYVADIPIGTDSRQLWIDGHLASGTSIEVPRSAVEFTTEGIILKDARFDYLAELPNQGSMEVESTGFFTDRFSPVEKISGHTLVMKQPAWDNNIWGYDSISSPYHPELSHLYLSNSLAFLSQPGQW